MDDIRIRQTHKKWITVVGIILALIFTNPTNVQGLKTLAANNSTGPYVDEVIYRVIDRQDDRILALLAGEIEMDTNFLYTADLSTLDADPNIDIYSAMRNGYGHITINCAKYPLNISGLRRAFAFAFNKTKITDVIMDGYSIEHDSLVPQPNGWCVEDEFDWHYYTAQADIGNQILDDLGFEINATSGFRLAPDGTPFEIVVEFAGAGINYYSTSDIVVEALQSLHIDAREKMSDYVEYRDRLDNHGDYDMVFYAVNFYSNDVDWLAYEYWSEYADEEYQNPTNFRNATYDSWRDQLLYGTTYEDVFEAASEMQKILQYNVPRLVVYENTYMQGYRNDQFTGHVEDLGRYITGPWTMRKIHKLDGTFGGSVPVAIRNEPDSFNIFIANPDYSANILDCFWPSLYRYGPDLNPWPDIATNLLTETHSDNPAVLEGHTRFTIDIVHNATWSDGTPLTGADVAFTFTYEFESGVYGNPAARDIGDLVAAYSPTPYSAVIEYNTESYWHFSNFAFDYIIPEHIFNEDTGIGYEGWETWKPVFDPAEPHVTCGPFMIADYEAGEFYELTFNPLFHYAIDICCTTTSTTTSTTTISPPISTGTIIETTNQTTVLTIFDPFVLSITLASGSLVIIIVCIVIIFRKRRD